MSTTRYALVGTGMRSAMYIDAIVGQHADRATLVALSDVNTGRLADRQDRCVAAGAARPASFPPEELEEAIDRHRVDRLIVTSPDWTHAEYVTRGLRAGVDVVVEKPLTIDAAGCASIARAIRDTGRSVVTTFNYRYSPRNSALREVIASGAIGQVTSVHFEWVLDTQHGADYFRRWHREKANSGGLLVHKASHHFDLVNWWIDDVPTRVFASGGLRFYGRANAEARSLLPRPSRGSLDEARGVPFALDMRADPALSALYLDHEHLDGYLRDRDVFDPGITIEDNMSLVVDYAGGPSMSYSLNAHSPWEGYTVGINGTDGRVELSVVERGQVAVDDVVDASAAAGHREGGTLRPASERILLQRHWKPAELVPIAAGEGGHGGGDVRLLSDVFVGPQDDPLSRPAGCLDGIRAVAVGVAANRSLAEGRPVRVADLGLGCDLGR